MCSPLPQDWHLVVNKARKVVSWRYTSYWNAFLLNFFKCYSFHCYHPQTKLSQVSVCPRSGLVSVSVQGVSVQGGSLSKRGGISVHGGSLSKGISVQGISVRGGVLCSGGSLSGRPGGTYPTGMHSCLNMAAIIGVVEHAREDSSDGHGTTPPPWMGTTVTHTIRVLEDFKVSRVFQDNIELYIWSLNFHQTIKWN